MTGLIILAVLNVLVSGIAMMAGVESLVVARRNRLQLRRLWLASVASVKAERRETIGKLQGILAAAQGSDDSYGRSETMPFTPWENAGSRDRSGLAAAIKGAARNDDIPAFCGNDAPIHCPDGCCACGKYRLNDYVELHDEIGNRVLKHTRTTCNV